MLSTLLLALLAGPAQDVRDLDPLLAPIRAEQNLPAVAALVLKGGRIVAEGAVGVRRAGHPERVTRDDRWHLGSNTKAMTATLIAVLVEKGELRWDLTIAEGLPDLGDSIREEYRPVTLEMLCANAGGMEPAFAHKALWAELWQREGTPTEQRRRMAKAILALPPTHAPGTYHYSNCNFAVAGHIAESVTGRSWEDLMRRHLFQPLGLKSAGFGVPWAIEPASDPWPHDASGQALRPGPQVDNPPAIGPGGTVHMSLRDWAVFVGDHLAGARGKDGKLLTAASYQRLHQGHVQIGKGPDHYALGWIRTKRPWAKGRKLGASSWVLFHNGSNNSWFTNLWIAPETNLAYLVATNIGGPGVGARLDKVVAAVIADQAGRR